MNPTWQTDDARVKLWLADCLDVLPTLEADHCITDPPYGIAYQHGGGGLNGFKAKAKAKGAMWAYERNAKEPIAGDDKPFDPTPLLRFQSVLMFGADHYRARLPEGGTMLCWDKSCGKGPADSFADAEFAWTNRCGIKRNVCRYLWKGMACVKAGEHNGCGGVWREHPTQKPIGLMKWCIEILVVGNDESVVDPFMGSGTTGVACVRLGRKFLGVEKEPKYFEIAKRRIIAELERMPLFEERPTYRQAELINQEIQF